MAIYSLDQILKLIIEWEEKLLEFYGIMHKNLKNPRAIKAVDALKKEQQETVKVFHQIRLADYKGVEFIKNVPDFHSEDVIPHIKFTENANPEDVFDKILEYEEKLEEYYQNLRKILAFPKAKDILDTLIQYKLGQIKKIKTLLDGFDLAV